MEKDMVLAPEELYYMGQFLQAKYIDYAYVAAVSDIKSNYALFESETRAALVAKGILMEDFGGDLEVDDAARALLTPIFFGETETSLIVCKTADTNTVSVHKFHFHDGIATMVHTQNGKLVIQAVDQLYIQNMVNELLALSYQVESATVQAIDKEHITRVLTIKSVVVGQHATVKMYIESDGVVYQEQDQTIQSVTRDTFVSDVYGILKGV